MNKNALGFQRLVEDFLSSPNLTSKRWIYEQYDTDIGTNRILGPGQNAGLIRVDNTHLALAACVDCRSDYVFINPYKGAQHSVAESYRNIISTGAVPVGLTNCLNFANPYEPENFYYFEKAVKGMSDAAKFFEIPITGGNVSFYNESDEGPVLPTPVIGMIGIHQSPENALNTFVRPGQKIYLWGDFKPKSETSYYYYYHQKRWGMSLPHLDLDIEKKLGSLFLKNFNESIWESSIDISMGGLMSSLLRMIFSSNQAYQNRLGFRFHPDTLHQLLKKCDNYDNLLWGESAHSYLVSVKKDQESRFLDSMASGRSLKNDKKNLYFQPEIFFLGEVNDREEMYLREEMVISLKQAYHQWSSLWYD